jgi:hypothetical protein
MMKFGLLNYSRSRNFGDQIQSIAARQFLPKVDSNLDRDYLSEYDSEEEIRLIMNGWFMAEPQNWPPSKSIKPLLVSFHITHDYDANEKLFSPEAIEFYKNNEPVGCRDYFTLDLMKSHGINAYYSGCLTLTLQNNFKAISKTDNIYMVDVLYKVGGRSHDLIGKFKRKWLIRQIIPPDVLQKAENITQVVPKGTSKKKKFEIAEETLKKYASAKLVITSRIHCALPCVALNIPVIFIDGGLDHATDQTRLKGISEYFNTYSIFSVVNQYRGYLHELFSNIEFKNPLKIDWNNPQKNPTKHLKIAESLREKCRSFIANE